MYNETMQAVGLETQSSGIAPKMQMKSAAFGKILMRNLFANGTAGEWFDPKQILGDVMKEFYKIQAEGVAATLHRDVYASFRDLEAWSPKQ